MLIVVISHCMLQERDEQAIHACAVVGRHCIVVILEPLVSGGRKIFQCLKDIRFPFGNGGVAATGRL